MISASIAGEGYKPAIEADIIDAEEVPDGPEERE